MDLKAEYLKDVDSAVAAIDESIKTLQAERDRLLKSSIRIRMVERLLRKHVPKEKYNEIITSPGTYITSKTNDGQFTGGELTTTETWNIGGVIYEITFDGVSLSADTVQHIEIVDNP